MANTTTKVSLNNMYKFLTERGSIPIKIEDFQVFNDDVSAIRVQTSTQSLDLITFLHSVYASVEEYGENKGIIYDAQCFDDLANSNALGYTILEIYPEMTK